MSLVYEAVNLEQPETGWRRLSGNDAEDTLYAVSATGRRHHDRSEAPMLSLKAMVRGRAQYRFGRRAYAVEDDTLLVCSGSDIYDVELAGRDEKESFCLFVPHPVARELWGTVSTSHAAQLDDLQRGTRPRFPEIATCGWTDLAGRVAGLRKALAAGEADDNDAALLLLEALLRVRRLLQGAEALPALKSATRTELLRRLLRARDLIDADPAARPALEQLARHAGLSRYHLLRSFVCAFGETPGNYAARQRIDRAARLLGATRLPIVEIAARTAFASQSAFTRSFSRWRGLSPARYRAALR